MNRMKMWFIHLKFRRKILFITLFVSLVPVMMLGSIWYHQIQDLLISREERNLEESLNQVVSELQYKLANYTNVINQIAWNEDIKRGIGTDYEDNYEMYHFYRYTLDPHLMNAELLQKDIKSITIYSNNEMNPHGQFLRPLRDIENKSWYQDVLKTSNPVMVVSPQNETFDIYSEIFDKNHDYTNIVHINISFNKVFHSMPILFEKDYGVVILDGEQQPVYFYEDVRNQNSSTDYRTEGFLEKLKDGSVEEDYVYRKVFLPTNDWSFYLYRPMNVVSNTVNAFTNSILAIIVSVILILFLAIVILTRVIVRPLEKLTRNMEEIENGDWSVTVFHTSKDEIGQLIRRFGSMVHRINEMIDQVYKSRIAQQEYEMKALQAQINPHFFYNSLSLINSKAIMAEQDDISEMAQLLSTFYRTTLNKGKSTILVKEELQNTISYIEIQQMMHSHSFHVEYDIDESVNNYTMINLLLQPLVENAIIHGIDHIEGDKKGILQIQVLQTNEHLQFVVRDNGCGMDRETLNDILDKDKEGYGVKNVHHRVQIYYGPDYGLRYESQLGEGTTVFLTLPKGKVDI